ncbi:MAG: DUF1553 domain-containing protein [Bryobacteraceae bacterium]
MDRTGLLFPVLLAVNAAVCAAQPSTRPVNFDRDIRPILSDNCFSCHGPDEKKRLANLRFDIQDGGAYSKRGSYQIIVPGDSKSSRLFQRVSASNSASRMPPPNATTTLTPQQIELLKDWIDQGAKWEVHWAFVAPKAIDPPAVKDVSWVRNPIDNFVLARLDKEGLKPSPEAAKATLLRRVTLDLTGLPPTLEELDSYLADRSPDAYEKRVDALLKSPRYGERMAMPWLDLARYADTHGYHIDSHREMWHWRDWVISAFNRNMPYDEFTIDQIAGDLLPNATVEQKVASGFNRNHMINFEGGAIPEEYQVEYVVDRVEATSATWLGLTMGCARCHDHKYDPIKQKEFYRFFAFFNNISEEGLDGRTGNAEPYLQLPSAEQKKRQDDLKEAICAYEELLPEDQVAARQKAWEQAEFARLPEAPRDGLLAHYEFDGNLNDSSGRYHYGRVVDGDITYDTGAVGKSAEFDGQTQVMFGHVPSFERDAPFAISWWMSANQKLGMPVLQQIADASSRRGIEIALDDFALTAVQQRSPRMYIRLTQSWPGNAIAVRTADRIVAKKDMMSHVVVDYDGSGKASGLRVYVDGELVKLETLADTLSGPTHTDAALQIGNKDFGLPFKGSLDDLRIYSREITPADIAAMGPLRGVLNTLPNKRSKEQKAWIRDYYLSNAAPPDSQWNWAELKTLREDEKHLNKAIPTTMVMSELIEKPRETFILGRGDYRNHGDKVTPGVPAVLPPLPKDEPANRLTLAKWLVSPSNPLTARVAVNRYWQMYFGTGIVKTTENFGSQADPPSHPELLDWLATEFVRSAWDVRAMQKLIVTSAAYRQSSRVTPELLERDPENRLLARGPRFRLPAEAVRDNALFVGGLLKEREGGVGVKPYQPKGLWEEIAFGDGFSEQTYEQGSGDDLYRRSLYTFWKRTSPPPEMITFDAPDREKCLARRTLTNTPLQALALLNDPAFVEAARGLAERTMASAGSNPDNRIRYAFRLATDREPEPREIKVLHQEFVDELKHYKQDRDDAAKLLTVGESPLPATMNKPELAAWTTVASIILNLDETITKE